MSTARFIKKIENGGVDLPPTVRMPERIKSKVDEGGLRIGTVGGAAADAAEASSLAVREAAAAEMKAKADAEAAANATHRKVRAVPKVKDADTSDVRELKGIIAEKEKEIQDLLAKMGELTTRLDRLVYTLDPTK